MREGTSPLTARERDALIGVAGGETAGAIGRRLHLSEGTVRNHLSSAITKTGATTSAGAAAIARDRGWM